MTRTTVHKNIVLIVNLLQRKGRIKLRQRCQTLWSHNLRELKNFRRDTKPGITTQ